MEAKGHSIDPSKAVVAIDGPAASGKSTVGRAAARGLGLRFLDTGIMYRAVTWLALHRQIPVSDAGAIGQLARDCRIGVEAAGPEKSVISIDGHRPGGALNDPEVDRNVSAVSAVSEVRAALVRQQRIIAGDLGIVMVGRDIGSVVLPAADAKIYIDASPEVRARRRLEQMENEVASVDFQQVLADTLRRDGLDMQRADSPLRVAEGASVINTDNMSLDESVAAVIAAVHAAIDRASGASETGQSRGVVV